MKQEKHAVRSGSESPAEDATPREVAGSPSGPSKREEQLLEAARHLTASLDVKEVLTRIAVGAKDILDAYGCAIYRLEADGKMLAPVVAIEPPYEEEVLSTPITVETSFTGQAVKARRGLVFNDAMSDSSGQQIPGTPEEEDERVMVAPFIVDGEVLGAMCLKRTGTPFTQEDLALGETFATLASTALENARAHRNLQHEVEERRRAEHALGESKRKIEELHEVARRLQSCQAEQEACEVTVEAAQQILNLTDWRLSEVESDESRTYMGSNGSRSPGENQSIGIATPPAAGNAARFHGRLRERVQDTGAPSPSSGRIAVPVGDGTVFEASWVEPNTFTHDDEQLLDLLLGHLAEALKRIRLQNELREQAIRDPLTKVYNRHYLDQALKQEVKRSTRQNSPIAFLMVDVDGLKAINDRYGHQAGDTVLTAVALLLSNEVRETDIIVRYGGDEFLVILPEAGDRAESIRKRIRGRARSLNGQVDPVRDRIALSVGTASWSPGNRHTVEEVLAEADKRMYADKRRSREPGRDS